MGTQNFLNIPLPSDVTQIPRFHLGHEPPVLHKRKIPKRLVFAQVSPLGSPFALYEPITLSSMPSLPEWTSQEPA